MNRILPLLLMLQVQVFAQVNRMPVSIEQIPGSGFQFVHTTSHQPVNPIIWIEAEPFVNGFSRVMDNAGFSFVNLQGQPVTQARYEATRNFSQGLAAVRKNNQWGFIRSSGQVAIPFQYTIAYDFTSPVTAVLQNKQWFLINTNGTVIARPDISVCYGFQGTEARVTKNGREGMMNQAGEIRWISEAIPALRQQQATIQNANGDCPDNIDFEFGNFRNWTCYTGRVDSVGNTNVITVNQSGPINNRHTIVPRTNPSAIDPYGLFPINPPDGSNYAVRLGNTNIGAQAERIRYTINVPANDSNFSIKYDYAVVFQDPGHSNWTQPRFQARLFDSAANRYIDCASFEYISTSSLPGFAVSTVDTSVIYKPWASVFISLRDYPGRTLFLEFTNADCVRRGHWGYAYVDIESTCRNNFNLQYNCGTPATASISAPPGFQTYNWWNQNFSTLLASGQNVVLNPAPAINSTVWVEMIPFQDFGCRDTFPVTMTSTFTPTIHASAHQAVCAPHSFTFFNADAPSASAQWNFGDGITASGDTVTHVFQHAGTYIVTLNVQLNNGCTGMSTDTVTIVEPTASLSYTGGNFCNSRNVRFTAVTSLVDSLVWDFGDGTTLTTTQSTVSHTYTAAGIFIPTVTAISNSGCQIRVTGADTIRIEDVLAGFQYLVQPSCGSAVLTVTDTSSATFGIQAYHWNMGAGNTATGPTATQTFTQSGSYNIQLIVTGVLGCRDTVMHPVPVDIYAFPAISINGPDSVCANTPVTLLAQSSDTIQLYEWTFNGNITSGSSYSLNTTLPGTYQVQLIGYSNHGCPDTSIHQVFVKTLPDVLRQASSTLCHGSTSPTVTLSGAVMGTVFQWTNDQPSIGLAASGTGNIPSFTANNTSGMPLTANITVTPIANGCAGNASSFSITVNPIPFVSQPDNQDLCNREASQAVVFNSFSGSTTYSWTNSLPSIGLAANGTGNIPSFNAINHSDTIQVATVSITATDNGCLSAPISLSISIKPSPIVRMNDMTVCQGSTVPAVMPVSNLSGTQFSWTNSQTAIGLAASGNGQIPAFTAQLPGSTPMIADVVVNSIANGCQGLPVNMTITVNPLPQVAQPSNQSLCTGEMTSQVIFTGTQSAADYHWTNNQTSIGLMQQGSGDIPSFSTVNFGSNPVTATVTVIPMLSACTGSPVDFTFTVYPLANLVQPLNQFLCNGENTAPVSFFGTTGGTVFSWTNDNTAIGLAASGTGNIPTFTAVNPSNTTVSANITVTAMANSCPGVSRTFKIFVDPTPGMAQPDNITVCSGSAVNPSGFAATVTGTTFSWINTASSIGLAASGQGDLPAFTAVNNTAYPITAIVTVTGFANSCASVNRVFTITVYPQPVVDHVSDQGICHGASAGAINFTGNSGVTGFTWTNSQPSIGLAANGTGDIPFFMASNTSQSDLVAQIMVSATNPGCAGAPVPFNITVHPLPALQATADTRLCRGQSVQLSASNAATYSWSPSQYLSCSDCANPLATPTGNISYVVEGITAFGCRGKDTVAINVIQRFNMQVSGPDTICIGESAQLLASGAASYQWTPASSLNHADIANPVATPTATTRYRVVGYDANQCFTDTGYVTITVGNLPQVNIGPDMNVTAGTVLTLNPVAQNGPIVQWTWTPPSGLSCADCQNPVLTISQPTTYILTVQNNYGCFGSDTLVVNSFCKSSQVFVPNAFTPDGDGLNDILMVRGKGIRVKSFRIFNRWGNLVFERLNFAPNDPGYGWDGKVNGVAASPDVFVYTTEVICDSGVIQTLKGNTTILK